MKLREDLFLNQSFGEEGGSQVKSPLNI